jgi:hypothetical protein
MAAPLDNARAVLDLLAGCGDGGVPPPTAGPIRRLVARFARAKRVAKTRRPKQDLILKAQSLKHNTTGEARTQGFLFYVAPDVPLGPLRGTGQWVSGRPMQF